MEPSEVVERALSHVSEKLWSDYTKSDYTIEQWHAACLIHLHNGPPTSKSQCKLPVKTPNGALNRNGVHAAAAALAGARSPLKAPPEQKAKAASALRRYYSQLGETPPDSLKQSALNAVKEVLTHQGSNTNSLVIVAIPKEDDYVNKISSEKVPHMTLLFLGEDVSQVKNFAKIMDFAKHAADTSLKRFSLEVDRREILGPDEADTLIFSKARWSGFNEINNYRSYLLKDDNIRIAYESATQFPEWIPHITLGYPETPANPDNRDYPGIRYVEFDKIAVWFGDYEGVEFPLRSYDWEIDMAMSTSEIVERVLSHHGVMGMKWGRQGASRTATTSKSDRKTARGDKKFVQRLTKPNKNLSLKIELHNATAKAMNDNHIPRINKKYRKAIDSHILLDEEHPTSKKYFKEMTDAYIGELNKEASKMTNSSGTRQYQVHKSTQDSLGFVVSATDVKVKHAASSTSFRVEYIKDDKGQVIGFKIRDTALAHSALIVEDILSHHGVMGMKWGRRKTTVGPQEVVVSDKRKRLKTSGGAGHPAHPDAVSVRRTGQIAKKSGVKALSDKELQDYAKRIQLEQNVKRLSYSEKPAAARFVRRILGATGQQTAQNAANDVAAQQVKKALVKAALVAA